MFTNCTRIVVGDVWPIGLQSVLNASWLHLHFYLHVVQHNPIAV